MMHMCYLHPAVPSLPFIHTLIKEVPVTTQISKYSPGGQGAAPSPGHSASDVLSGEGDFTVWLSNIFLFPTEKAKVACGLELERP